MAFDTIEMFVVSVSLFIGLVGGVPQILKWIKPKPNLTITKATISRLPEENYKYRFHLEVENKKASFRRNGDASNITFDFYVVDKDSVQRGGTFDQVITQYLLAGFKVTKETDVYLSLPPDGNPYTVVFRLVCREGQSAILKVAFEAPPIVYN
jgi:hypothetical protein